MTNQVPRPEIEHTIWDRAVFDRVGRGDRGSRLVEPHHPVGGLVHPVTDHERLHAGLALARAVLVAEGAEIATGSAGQDVDAGPARQRIVVRLTEDPVGAAAAVDRVVPGTGADEVVAAATIDDVTRHRRETMTSARFVPTIRSGPGLPTIVATCPGSGGSATMQPAFPWRPSPQPTAITAAAKPSPSRIIPPSFSARCASPSRTSAEYQLLSSEAAARAVLSPPKSRVNWPTVRPRDVGRSSRTSD